MTLIEILEKNARLLPEKIVIIHKESRISFRSLYENTNALADFLVRSGLKKSDRVGVLLQKTPEAIVSFLGIAKAGGVAFPIDFNQPQDQIRYVLDLTKPNVLIVASGFVPLLSRLKFDDTGVKTIIVGAPEEKGHFSWNEIVGQKAGGVQGCEIKEEDPVYLNFTSGTTGVPKGAITTHANIHWNTVSSIKAMELTCDDVHLCGFPVFSHPHELFARALYLGGTVVLTDDVLPKTLASAISEHKVTCMMGIALVYENLVRYAVAPGDLKTLRLAESGGMFARPDLLRDFEKHFNIPIVPVWGSTETTGIALAVPLHGGYPSGSMGRSCPYYEVKITGEDGNELNAGEVGEMLIKGPAVCSGYFNNAKETEEYMRDGWLHTGDLVKKDAEGYFYFVSRKTGMMKVAGLRVFPLEIEEVLMAHPLIAEAAVVKMSDTVLGEVPKAFVVLKNNTEMSQDALRSYCAKRLAKHKVPAVIDFLNELPKTAGGKILYQKLQLAI